MARTNIVNVGYRSTNFWVVSAGTSRLMVDLGWPGMMGDLRAAMKRMDVPIGEIKYGLATHYHMDHAGLAQDLKRLGMKLLVLETQAAWIAPMKKFMKPADNYTDITLDDNVNITFAASRALLAKIDLAGQIVTTPGHSDDSVSLLLDGGEVFTGDLTPLQLAGEQDGAAVAGSWRALRELGATTVYPGHGPTRYMPTDIPG